MFEPDVPAVRSAPDGRSEGGSMKRVIFLTLAVLLPQTPRFVGHVNQGNVVEACLRRPCSSRCRTLDTGRDGPCKGQGRHGQVHGQRVWSNSGHRMSCGPAEHSIRLSPHSQMVAAVTSSGAAPIGVRTSTCGRWERPNVRYLRTELNRCSRSHLSPWLLRSKSSLLRSKSEPGNRVASTGRRRL